MATLDLRRRIAGQLRKDADAKDLDLVMRQRMRDAAQQLDDAAAGLERLQQIMQDATMQARQLTTSLNELKAELKPQ